MLYDKELLFDEVQSHLAYLETIIFLAYFRVA